MSIAFKAVVLPIKKKWFDMIASGEKKEEYRKISDYYAKRLIGNKPDVVEFRNGYGLKVPRINCTIISIKIGEGRPEWGAEPGVKYYVIELSKPWEG